MNLKEMGLYVVGLEGRKKKGQMIQFYYHLQREKSAIEAG